MKEKLIKFLHLKGCLHRFVMFVLNNFLCGTKYFSLKRFLLRLIGFKIGQNTKIVGPIESTAYFCIGENCWIGKNLTINGNGKVIIGNNVDIAPEVTILTGGHKIGSCERRAGVGETYQIVIEDSCWICARATIGRSIKIGKGVVVAACACVMSDIPKNTLVGGVPAKVIKYL